MADNKITMNFSAVARSVADKTGLSIKEVKRVLAAEAEAVREGLETVNEVVILNGDAKVLVRDVAPRTIRNPQTGEQMHKPASKAVKFKALSALKSVVS